MESGIGGPKGGCRIFCRTDALNIFGLKHKLDALLPNAHHNVAGQFMPVRVARRGEVVEPKRKWVSDISFFGKGAPRTDLLVKPIGSPDVSGTIGDEGGRGGCAHLVPHHPQFAPCGGELENGSHEIMAVCSQNPACPQDNVAVGRILYARLTRGLAAPIFIDG